MIKQLDKLCSLLFNNILYLYGKFSLLRYKNISKDINKYQLKLLKKIVDNNKNTSYGKKYDFKNIKNVYEYQKNVPLSTYDDYSKYIEIMKESGTQKLLTNDNVTYFAKTSGTTGNAKFIPVTKRAYSPYLSCASIYYPITKKILKNRKIKFIGKGLNLIETENEKTHGGIRAGFISGFVISDNKVFPSFINALPIETLDFGDEVDMKYVKARFALEEPNLIYLVAVFMSSLTDLMKYIEDNKNILINDINLGSIDKNIKMSKEVRNKLEKKLKANPKRAEELTEIFKAKTFENIIPKIWPKLSLIVAIHTGEFAPFETKMRYYTGNDVKFCNEMYASSESLIASITDNSTKNYELIADSAFYEFIPVDEPDKILLAGELEKDKLYEVVLTNLSGFYRYQIKDVIRVKGFHNTTPIIEFAYRKAQVINVGGVHLTMEHISKTMKEYEKALDNKITDYSIYVNNESTPSLFEIYVELKDKNKVKNISKLFDKVLSDNNKEYGRMLKVGELNNSIVHIVKNGTYEKYRNNKIKKGIAVNQIKTIRFLKNDEILEYFNSNTVGGKNEKGIQNLKYV